MHTTTPPLLPTSSDVLQAALRIRGAAHRTPVLTSRLTDARAGATLFFKAEPFQRAGAFKFRGAYNALASLDEEARASGVLAYSSGNHAGAIALAGQMLGIPVTVIMPGDAPRAKREATEAYGATVVAYNRATQDREEVARAYVAAHPMPVIPPYNHPAIIAGAGTAALELFEDVGPLDALVVCCGGGGLLSGSALAAHHLSPSCRVIGVEPEAGDDGRRSFISGQIQTVHNPDTIADGARTPSLGTLTFPIIQAHVDAMETVSDAQLLSAMRWLWTRLKVVVEPTGALAAAYVLHNPEAFAGKRVGVMLSGGNVDLEAMAQLLAP